MVTQGQKEIVKAKTTTKVLPDVKARTPRKTAKPYQVAFTQKGDSRLFIGQQTMTLEEAKGVIKNQQLWNMINLNQKNVSKRMVGVYAQKQEYAKKLAQETGLAEGVPEVHGNGFYGHYHDGAHTCHIWYGDSIKW